MDRDEFLEEKQEMTLLVMKSIADAKESVATNASLQKMELRSEIATLDKAIRGEVTSLDKELNAKLAGFGDKLGELKAELAAAKTEAAWKNVALFVATIIALLAGVANMLKQAH